MAYAIHGLGWFVFDAKPIMVMDDFGNAVVPNCGGWLASLQDLGDI